MDVVDGAEHHRAMLNTRHADTDKTLLEMTSDPKNRNKLLLGIHAAVKSSYERDLRDARGNAITTEAEAKRRCNLCIDMAKQLRHDAGWSIPRIVDALPKMLRRKLDGQDFDPTTETARSTWFASS